MKSPEYIAHGTSSEKDAKKIGQEGFEAQEGRATVSTDLLYALEWATDQEKRKGSKSKTEIGYEEKGKILVMEVPKDKQVDYATHTGIEADEDSKEITGYSSKFISGEKQLAVYNKEEVDEKRKKIEEAKEELAKIKEEREEYFKSLGVDVSGIKSIEDLRDALQTFDLDKQIEALKAAEVFEKRIKEKRDEAEVSIKIEKENIVLSIVPTERLKKELERIREKIDALQSVSAEEFIDGICAAIREGEDNFIKDGVYLEKTVGELVSSTIESLVVNRMRDLSMDVRRANGYRIYNRGRTEEIKKEVNKEALKEKISRIKDAVESGQFDLGSENLNRYVKIVVGRLSKELDSGSSPE